MTLCNELTSQLFAKPALKQTPRLPLLHDTRLSSVFCLYLRAFVKVRLQFVHFWKPYYTQCMMDRYQAETCAELLVTSFVIALTASFPLKESS